MPDSDHLPLDGRTPLSEAEIKHLRRLLRDDDRATWAMRQLRWILPAAVAIVVAVWQAIEWVVRHVKPSP